MPATTITAVEAIPVRVPRRPAIRLLTAHGTDEWTTCVLVQLHTAAGLTGLGEATVDARWNGEDTATALRCIRRYLAPEVVGENPLHLEHIVRKMDRRTKANPFAKAAVEMACWDLAGKLLGVPVFTLLGGKVREQVRTKFVVTATTPDRAAALARDYVAHGFGAIKVKVGLDPREDVARVLAVREAVGPSILVTVDANTGWSVPAAVWALRRLAPCDLTVAEQPVPAGNPHLLAEVRRAVSVPIMADESVFSLADAAALAREGAVDVLSLYPGKHGGLLQAKKLAHFAEVWGLGATIGSNLELGIATAAMAHFGVATPAIDPETYPADIIGPLYHEHDIVTDTSFVQPGYAVAPDGQGLGVTLDVDAVREYQVSEGALDG